MEIVMSQIFNRRKYDMICISFINVSAKVTTLNRKIFRGFREFCPLNPRKLFEKTKFTKLNLRNFLEIVQSIAKINTRETLCFDLFF